MSMTTISSPFLFSRKFAIVRAKSNASRFHLSARLDKIDILLYFIQWNVKQRRIDRTTGLQFTLIELDLLNRHFP